ncbi:MAG: ATP-binding protein [Bacteroidetes bacterium]|nr:ATP-binding protein [Bacteroidota bacterium]
MRQKNNWYVITGGPSSGKTTLINRLKELGYKTTEEIARHYMDIQRENGHPVEEVRSHQNEFQLAVLRMQVEVEQQLLPEEVVFLDRAIPDAHAYYHFLHIPEHPELAKALENVSYKKVFILDCLPLVNDYARVENEEAQLKIHEELIAVYEALPFPVVRVPVLSVEERVAFVLNNL